MLLKRICIFTFVLIIAAGCNQQVEPELEVIIDKTKLQEGDLVFRLGRSRSSRIVNFADKERSYSHIGLLVKNSLGEWCVIHAVPGESEETEGREIIKCDLLLHFFGADRTVIGIVMRFDSIAPISQQIVDKIKELYDKELPFDHNYALSDISTVYCTEFVYRVFLSAGIDLSEGRRHTIPLFKEAIIFPSDILKNKALQEVCEVSFVKKN
ncbi:MAG: hypothetical protein FWE63_04745 [Bacteroidales bacterium]|nr:hypothetical protein [Bacteroidales bacterium]